MEDPMLKAGNDDYPLYPSDPEKIPDSTYWPAALAFGSLLFFWGLITSLFVTGVGFICIALSLTGWIFELNYE